MRLLRIGAIGIVAVDDTRGFPVVAAVRIFDWRSGFGCWRRWSWRRLLQIFTGQVAERDDQYDEQYVEFHILQPKVNKTRKARDWAKLSGDGCTGQLH